MGKWLAAVVVRSATAGETMPRPPAQQAAAVGVPTSGGARALEVALPGCFPARGPRAQPAPDAAAGPYADAALTGRSSTRLGPTCDQRQRTRDRSGRHQDDRGAGQNDGGGARHAGRCRKG